jgi:hypothetical protein
MPNPLTDLIAPKGRIGSLTLLTLLAVSMLATRYHHFSSMLHLADTSWAVFFLAGLWFRRAAVLGGLIGLAVAIDLGSVVIDGAAMASCFSPAYPGVLLAYAALWGIGRLAGQGLERGTPAGRLPGLILVAAALLIGVVAAFGISNLTFFAFSGQFTHLSASDYAARVSGYLAGYLGTATVYVSAALVALAGISLLQRDGEARSA